MYPFVEEIHLRRNTNFSQETLFLYYQQERQHINFLWIKIREVFVMFWLRNNIHVLQCIPLEGVDTIGIGCTNTLDLMNL